MPVHNIQRLVNLSIVWGLNVQFKNKNAYAENEGQTKFSELSR